MQWYPWYWADYSADTFHLSLEQDAIYRRLLDWYMASEKPLPCNSNALASICRIGVDKWLEHESVIFEFFVKRGKFLHHKRCDAELSVQGRLREKRSAAAKSRWDKEKDTCKSNANDMHRPDQTDPTQHTDITDPTEHETRRSSTTNGNHSEWEGSSKINGFGVEVGFVPTLSTASQLMSIAPGWNQHELIDKYNQWQRGRERPNSPQAAFIGWAKRFTKGQRPS